MASNGGEADDLETVPVEIPGVGKGNQIQCIFIKKWNGRLSKDDI